MDLLLWDDADRTGDSSGARSQGASGVAGSGAGASTKKKARKSKKASSSRHRSGTGGLSEASSVLSIGERDADTTETDRDADAVPDYSVAPSDGAVLDADLVGTDRDPASDWDTGADIALTGHLGSTPSPQLQSVPSGAAAPVPLPLPAGPMPWHGSGVGSSSSASTVGHSSPQRGTGATGSTGVKSASAGSQTQADRVHSEPAPSSTAHARTGRGSAWTAVSTSSTGDDSDQHVDSAPMSASAATVAHGRRAGLPRALTTPMPSSASTVSAVSNAAPAPTVAAQDDSDQLSLRAAGATGSGRVSSRAVFSSGGACSSE